MTRRSIDDPEQARLYRFPELAEAMMQLVQNQNHLMLALNHSGRPPRPPNLQIGLVLKEKTR